MGSSVNVDVQLTFLYPGIILKGDAFDENNRLVNPAGKPFTSDQIENLRLAGVKTIHYAREKLSFKKEVTNPLLRDDVLEHTISIIQDVEERIKNSKGKFPEQEIKKTVGSIISNIKDNSAAYLNLLNMQDADSYTYNHSINTATISLLLARSLNLDDEKLVLLGAAALLHDIGKLKLPQELVMKPEKLSEAEWKAMKNHPVLGYNLLKQDEGFDPRVARAVLMHHENYSGGGYPLSINKEKQDALSQIIAIADAFDSMTSFKPYRHAHTNDEAFTLLMEQSGTHFNPIYTQIFIRDMVRKINEQPIYPADCFVLLNTGELGQVAGHRKSDFSLRPIVNIFYKSHEGISAANSFLKYAQQIDLEQDFQRFIIRRISDPAQVEKLSKILQALKNPVKK